MPNWNPEEIDQAADVIRGIDAFVCPRRSALQAPILHLRLSNAIPLIDGLAGNPRAVAIRQLCRAFGFDERQQLRWRLEHKLVQALVLNHYCPDEVPVTRGLCAFIGGMNASVLRCALHHEFEAGFYIKPALSDSTGDGEICDRTHLILAAIESGQERMPACRNIAHEIYIVQRRIDMVKEYRVHSMEDQVVEDCTFRRYGRGNIPGERDAPNAYIRGILAKLPDGIVGGSLYGWDVGLRHDGSFQIIEANPSGFHAFYKPGFHCSGFYHDLEWGANITARLLRFVEKVHDVIVVVDADTECHPPAQKFYSDLAYWQERLKTEP